ncbi:MAG: response regulator [Candidatus Omnitrophica bacterium]|nr:response regulator [Candidatus Omnitrophota bacterium]
MNEPKRILIIDDDVTAAESLKKLFNLSGFVAETVNKAKEALNKVKLFKPDLIILDLLMPEIGGLELCEMFNQDPQTARIPIIVISALSGYTDIKKAYKLGVLGYITKPYDFDQVLNEVKKILGE